MLIHKVRIEAHIGKQISAAPANDTSSGTGNDNISGDRR